MGRQILASGPASPDNQKFGNLFQPKFGEPMSVIPREANSPEYVAPSDGVLFAVTVFAGTSAGAVFYGLIQGGFAGAFFGPLFAMYVGFPVILAILVMAWSCWFGRIYPAVAIFGGALTGLLCSALYYSLFFTFPYVVSLVLATVLGGAGSGAAGAWFVRGTSAGRRLTSAAKNPISPLSPRQVVLHVVVLAVVGACMYRACTAIVTTNERVRQERIEMEMRPEGMRD